MGPVFVSRSPFFFLFFFCIEWQSGSNGDTQYISLSYGNEKERRYRATERERTIEQSLANVNFLFIVTFAVRMHVFVGAVMSCEERVSVSDEKVISTVVFTHISFEQCDGTQIKKIQSWASVLLLVADEATAAL